MATGRGLQNIRCGQAILTTNVWPQTKICSAIFTTGGIRRNSAITNAASRLPHRIEENEKTATDRTLSNTGATKMLPPHSLMPTPMLLRSWLISTVSTHRMLLSSTLRLLGILSSSKLWFFNIEKNPLWRLLLKKSFYDHFCAGENGQEVRSTIANIKSMGFRGVILTYAREIVVDANEEEKGVGAVALQDGKSSRLGGTEVHNPDIESWSVGVMESVEMVTEGDILALKLTGAGAAISEALSSRRLLPRQMKNALEKVCNRALERKVRIFVDAEQQAVQGGIDTVALDLMRKYNVGGNVVVYNTYQAYLVSTTSNLAAHLRLAAEESFALGVKLVRGAYIKSEPRGIIHATKQATDDCYNAIVGGLLSRTIEGVTRPEFPMVKVFLATHNKESALAAHAQQQKQATSPDQSAVSVQYGQLLGMADDVSLSLLQLGEVGKRSGRSDTVVLDVYKCLSWGSLADCVSYLLRRAVENRDAVSRTEHEREAVKKEVWRRLRSRLRLVR